MTKKKQTLVEQPWLAMSDVPYILPPSVLVKVGQVRGVRIRIRYRGRFGYICAINRDTKEVLIAFEDGRPPVWLSPEEITANPHDGLDQYEAVPWT